MLTQFHKKTHTHTHTYHTFVDEWPDFSISHILSVCSSTQRFNWIDFFFIFVGNHIRIILTSVIEYIYLVEFHMWWIKFALITVANCSIIHFAILGRNKTTKKGQSWKKVNRWKITVFDNMSNLEKKLTRFNGSVIIYFNLMIIWMRSYVSRN